MGRAKVSTKRMAATRVPVKQVPVRRVKREMKAIKAPGASRQVAFHQLLVAARKTYLMDALREALRAINPKAVKTELTDYVPADVQQILAAAGIRDEHVFPTPSIVGAKPTLVGCYRLLLGAPQKSFYAGVTGMGRFRSMEARGVMNTGQEAGLDDFCRAMSVSLAELVRQMSPQMTDRDVAELPLLTLGAQFQGSNNNTIGKKAIEGVFLSIRDIVKAHIVNESTTTVTVRNSAGRNVTIAVSADPDVLVAEEFPAGPHRKLAIEVKGGTDASNAHNRAGEAEKSHQKARAKGFPEFWTLIAKKGLDLEVLKAESPTTTAWFDVSQILGRQGQDWDTFRARLIGHVGIPME
jgi:hypothetical protein